MELGELNTFVTVAAERSFSLAAIRLCRTQPAVSLRIGGDEAAAHALLPALSIFLAKQPHLSIEFRRVTDQDILGGVGAGWHAGGAPVASHATTSRV